MIKLPLVSGRQLIKILSKLEYQEVRQRGGHIRLICSDKKSITVPDYKAIDRSLLRKILRDANLNVKEFIKIYQA